VDIKELQEADVVALALRDTTDPKKIARKTGLSVELVNERLEQLRDLISDNTSTHFLEAVQLNNDRLNVIIDNMISIVELKKSEKHALAAIKAIEAQNNLLGINSPQRKVINTTSKTIKLSFTGNNSGTTISE
jgi:hypothetical protein